MSEKRDKGIDVIIADTLLSAKERVEQLERYIDQIEEEIKQLKKINKKREKLEKLEHEKRKLLSQHERGHRRHH